MDSRQHIFSVCVSCVIPCMMISLDSRPSRGSPSYLLLFVLVTLGLVFMQLLRANKEISLLMQDLGSMREKLEASKEQMENTDRELRQTYNTWTSTKEERDGLSKKLEEAEDELRELRETKDEFQMERQETESEMQQMQEENGKCARDQERLILEVLIFYKFNQQFAQLQL